MLTVDALRTKPILHGQLVDLRPLGPEHSEAFWRSLRDPEVRRLTGTHTELRRDQIDAWLAGRSEHHDRLDLALHRHRLEQRERDRQVHQVRALRAARETTGVVLSQASAVLTEFRLPRPRRRLRLREATAPGGSQHVTASVTTPTTPRSE